MVKILPDLEFIKSRVKDDLLSSELQEFRNLAFKEYCAAQILQDKELERFMNLEIDYTSIPSKPLVISGSKDKDTIKEYFLNTDKNIIENLACAIYDNAQVIYVLKNSSNIDLDLNIILKNNLGISLLFIIIDENAQATININNYFTDAVAINNIVFFVKSGANLIIKKSQESDGNSNNISNIRIFLSEDAHCEIYQSIADAKLNYINIEYDLIGDNSSCEHKLFYVTKKSENIIIKSRQLHKAKNTKSNLEIKSVLLDQSRSFYRGLIDVEQDAIKTSAQQRHTALQLTNEAKNCAIPALQVKNADVECKHGSASGFIDKEQIWYLTSRGLEPKKAKSIIIDGFLSLAKCDNMLIKLRNYTQNYLESNG